MKRSEMVHQMTVILRVAGVKTNFCDKERELELLADLMLKMQERAWCNSEDYGSEWEPEDGL